MDTAPHNLYLVECQLCHYQVSVPVISAFLGDDGTKHVAICPMHACPDCFSNTWAPAHAQPTTREGLVDLWDPTYQEKESVSMKTSETVCIVCPQCWVNIHVPLLGAYVGTDSQYHLTVQARWCPACRAPLWGTLSPQTKVSTHA